MLGSRGFTMVEVMVAVILSSVGLLALLSTATVVNRTLIEAHSYTEASAVASQVLERLRSEGCIGIGDGSWSDGNRSVTFRLVEVSSELRRATVVVKTSNKGRVRADTFSVTVPC